MEGSGDSLTSRGLTGLSSAACCGIFPLGALSEAGKSGGVTATLPLALQSSGLPDQSARWCS